jgi:hypothetical protein
MKSYIKMLAVAASGLLFASCSDSFFDLQPDDQVSVDKVYTDANGFKLAVNGCYAKLQTQMDFYTEMCEYRSDDLYLNAPTAGTQDRYDISSFSETAANGILDDMWANFNNGIYRCNMVLDRIDEATFDESLKKQYKGEAMFIRAYTLFNMYRSWGTVPVARKVLSVSEALKVGRASESEMYTYIAGDLEQIINEGMLPTSYSAEDLGRVTLGAAKALLAKVYLTFGKYSEASAVLQSLIGGQYSLQSNILDVFDVDKKNNSEIIWAINYNKSIVSEGHGAWYSLTNLTDETNRTAAFDNLYTADDKRLEAIEYVQVPGVKVCLMKKFYDTIDSSTKQYGASNIILRYADVLLMYAEALNEISYSSSPSSPALAAINEVRTRAGLTPLDITDVPNQTAFRKAILLERQKEFPYEGQRWFDAVRMGAGIECAKNAGYDIQSYQLLFPIPQTELERINDTSLLWQNPGY